MCRNSWNRRRCLAIARASLRSVWVRRSAIRPVPRFARIPRYRLERVRESISGDDDETHTLIDSAFERFEKCQPALSAHVAQVLSEPLDETAVALGYFLAIAVWLSFDETHGQNVRELTAEGVQATVEALVLDEELRRSDPIEALETDDVIAMEQPELVAFVHEELDSALEAHAEDVDIDDVNIVFRLVLVEILGLSHCVRRPEGYAVYGAEVLA
jgi:hypothetical protein